jgi:hypothetical protein
MSFNGSKIFATNLSKLMDTKTFKEADFAKQVNLSWLLLRSKPIPLKCDPKK